MWRPSMEPWGCGHDTGDRPPPDADSRPRAPGEPCARLVVVCQHEVPMSEHWSIVPYVNNHAMTSQAVEDLLAQSLPTRVLLIGQGASAEDSDRMREFAERHHPRVLLWSWNPQMPSLSGVWN